MSYYKELIALVDPRYHNEFRKRHLRYDCKKSGCFNDALRPKWEIFVDCFDDGISIGDVDGIIEKNGYELVFEWKSFSERLNKGQHRMYKNTTRLGIKMVIIIVGDCKTMRIDKMKIYKRGKTYPSEEGWFDGDLVKLKKIIRNWIHTASDRLPSWEKYIETKQP